MMLSQPKYELKLKYLHFTFFLCSGYVTVTPLYVGVRKSANPEPSWPAGGGGDSLGVVPPYYLYEPSLTSIQLRQDNVKQLKKNDEYWEKRVRNLEENHKKMHEIMDLEYKKAVSKHQLYFYYSKNKLPNKKKHSLGQTL